MESFLCGRERYSTLFSGKTEKKNVFSDNFKGNWKFLHFYTLIKETKDELFDSAVDGTLNKLGTVGYRRAGQSISVLI